MIARNWPAEPLPLTAVAAPTLLFSGPCLLRGWSMENEGGSATDVLIMDGQDTKGTPVSAFNLASKGSSQIHLGDSGLYMEIGIYLASVAQQLAGAVWFTPLDDQELTQQDWQQGDQPSGGQHGPRG